MSGGSEINLKLKQKVQEEETLGSTVWIQILDESLVEIKLEDAKLSRRINVELDKGLGLSKNNPISIPLIAGPTCVVSAFESARSLLECSSDSEQECEPYIQSFEELDARRLADLLTVASQLQMKQLSKCTCEALYRKIRDKSSKQILKMLGLSDGLTEAQKLKLQSYPIGDPRRRLLSKLYAKGSQDIRNVVERVRVHSSASEHNQITTSQRETRSVDSLISFINSSDKDTREVHNSKKKKKSKKSRKQKKKNSSTVTDSNKEDQNASASAAAAAVDDDIQLLAAQDDSSSSDLDPELNEELDREVEDFARKLNLDLREIQ